MPSAASKGRQGSKSRLRPPAVPKRGSSNGKKAASSAGGGSAVASTSGAASTSAALPDSADLVDNAARALKSALAAGLSRASDLFQSLDTDGNGTIEKHEFVAAVAALGIVVSDDVCNAVFDEYDTDSSGRVSNSKWASSPVKWLGSKLVGR